LYALQRGQGKAEPVLSFTISSRPTLGKNRFLFQWTPEIHPREKMTITTRLPLLRRA